VVDLFAHQPQLTLGLLPVGTGNEVARVLGIPLDLASACRVIATGRVVEIDLAQANGNYFVHTGLVGYAAYANRHVPAWLKALLGKAAYFYVLASSLLHRRAFRARVATAGKCWEGETPLILVGNGRFHQPARALLPPREWRDGSLIVYGPRDSRWTTLLSLAISLWITRRPRPALLFCLSGREVSVHARPPQPTDLDGEYGRSTPVIFRLAPRALRMLVPASQEGE